MNTRFLLALALTAVGVTAQAALEENLLADPWLRQAPTFGAPASANNTWISTIERPAIGSVARETGHQLADSVMVANVRYLSATESATCSYSQTLIGLTPHQYRFSAWVKLEDQGSCLTLRATGSDGATLGSLSVASDGSATALTPGRWTPVELALDLSATSDAALSSVTFSIEPMVGEDGPVVDSDFHKMLIMHPFAGVVDNRSNITNGSMELWSPALEAWAASATTTQAAGLHVHDSAVTLAAGETLTSQSLEISSLKNTLQFAARADKDATVTVTSACGTSEVALPGGAWCMLEVPANIADTQALSFSLSANQPWSVDEVSLVPIYDHENPRPAERTLHVTTSDNDGEGSLRQVVASSLSGDEILIDVSYITLTEGIDLSDKSITIKSGTSSKSEITCQGAFSAFTINPTVDGHSLRFENVKITSSKGPERGAGLLIGADGGKASASVTMVSVTFNSCLATLEGGAIYCNAPNVDLYLINSSWESCGSAKGAFLYHAAGTVTMNGCKQGFYLGSDSTNEQIYAASSQGSLRLNACLFYELASSSRGTSFIHVEGSSPIVEITNSAFYPQWYFTVPETKVGYITVNNSARRGGGRILLANNTMYRVYEGPLMQLTNSVTAYAPQVYMVNNILLTNGDASVTNEKCTLQGSHNILASDLDGLDNTLISTWDKRDVFSFSYQQECDDFPMSNTAGETYLNEEGIAYHAGTPTFLVEDVNIVPAEDFAGRERPNPPSIGMSELAGHSGVEELEADVAAERVTAWYEPSARLIHIVGDVRQAALVSVSGVTQIVTSANEIDASRLTPGIFLLRVASQQGNITVHKLIIR